MKTLTVKDLQSLRSLYGNKGPKYIPTIALLDHFIDRFVNHPEWTDQVKFSTINERTLNDGTFMMAYATVDGPIIVFNSLEPKSIKNLAELLNTLNYSKENFYTFWTITEEFKILIENLVKAHDLEVIENYDCFCHVFKINRDDVLKMIKDAPDGFYYDSLKESDIPKIQSTLTYMVERGYLEAVINYNPTTALYTNDGELIAWAIMHESGESGMLEVVEQYKRRGIGRELVLRQTIKLLDKRRILFRYILHGNDVAKGFSEGVNEKISDATAAGKFNFVTLKPRINDNLKKSKL
ncbi:uncharacterized protein LOC119077407 [Bradysia coprophila]|uniref:uncharacterized protein LOC119077407 n=1 Tax=Bradysia coprophila TaxID=38358 RepID=UPI00187DA8B4|nr:uncharacterized protein LOC119077407 [Bradysia coprophila]